MQAGASQLDRKHTFFGRKQEVSRTHAVANLTLVALIYACETGGLSYCNSLDCSVKQQHTRQSCFRVTLRNPRLDKDTVSIRCRCSCPLKGQVCTAELDGRHRHRARSKGMRTARVEHAASPEMVRRHARHFKEASQGGVGEP